MTENVISEAAIRIVKITTNYFVIFSEIEIEMGRIHVFPLEKLLLMGGR